MNHKKYMEIRRIITVPYSVVSIDMYAGSCMFYLTSLVAHGSSSHPHPSLPSPLSSPLRSQLCQEYYHQHFGPHCDCHLTFETVEPFHSCAYA